MITCESTWREIEVNTAFLFVCLFLWFTLGWVASFYLEEGLVVTKWWKGGEVSRSCTDGGSPVYPAEWKWRDEPTLAPGTTLPGNYGSGELPILLSFSWRERKLDGALLDWCLPLSIWRKSPISAWMARNKCYSSATQESNCCGLNNLREMKGRCLINDMKTPSVGAAGLA